MSPIIYTPHRCAPAENPEVNTLGKDDVEGVIWQCPECQAYWEADVRRAPNGEVVSFVWVCVGSPRQEARRREVEAALNGTPAAPPKLPVPPARPKLTAAVEAVLDAWRVPGRAPMMHEAAKVEVRNSFPYLAARLDEACDTRG